VCVTKTPQAIVPDRLVYLACQGQIDASCQHLSVTRAAQLQAGLPSGADLNWRAGIDKRWVCDATPARYLFQVGRLTARIVIVRLCKQLCRHSSRAMAYLRQTIDACCQFRAGQWQELSRVTTAGSPQPGHHSRVTTQPGHHSRVTTVAVPQPVTTAGDGDRPRLPACCGDARRAANAASISSASEAAVGRSRRSRVPATTDWRGAAPVRCGCCGGGCGDENRIQLACGKESRAAQSSEDPPCLPPPPAAETSRSPRGQTEGRTDMPGQRPQAAAYPADSQRAQLGRRAGQLGHAVWELYCLEHGVQADGRPVRGRPAPGRRLSRHSAAMATGFTPRGRPCATRTPTVIRRGSHGAYRQLFAPDCLISHKEGAARQLRRGRPERGWSGHPATAVSQAVRAAGEACDRLEGLILYHSYGGGTGPASRAAAHGEPAQQLRQKTAAADGRVPFHQSELAGVLTKFADLALPGHRNRRALVNTVACLQACEPLSNGVIPAATMRLSHQLADRGFRFSRREQNATLADISTNRSLPRAHLPVAFVRADEAVRLRGVQRQASRISAAGGGGAVRRKPVRSKYAAKNKPFLAACMMFRAAALSVSEGKSVLGRTWSDLFGRIAHNDQATDASPADTGIDVGPSGAGGAQQHASRGWQVSKPLGRKFDSMFGQGAFLATYLANGYNRDQFVSAREHLSSIDQAYMESVDDPSVYDTPTASPGEQPRGPEQYRMKFSRPNGPGFHGRPQSRWLWSRMALVSMALVSMALVSMASGLDGPPRLTQARSQGPRLQKSPRF
uniref:Tubulin domain-containing protein n=1 Tax=Macrostomum lignano TaxID=282301 RepID=A0A1I8JQ71_9PLAT